MVKSRAPWLGGSAAGGGKAGAPAGGGGAGAPTIEEMTALSRAPWATLPPGRRGVNSVSIGEGLGRGAAPGNGGGLSPAAGRVPVGSGGGARPAPGTLPAKEGASGAFGKAGARGADPGKGANGGAVVGASGAAAGREPPSTPAKTLSSRLCNESTPMAPAPSDACPGAAGKGGAAGGAGAPGGAAGAGGPPMIPRSTSPSRLC